MRVRRVGPASTAGGAGGDEDEDERGGDGETGAEPSSIDAALALGAALAAGATAAAAPAGGAPGGGRSAQPCVPHAARTKAMVAERVRGIDGFDSVQPAARGASSRGASR